MECRCRSGIHAQLGYAISLVGPGSRRLHSTWSRVQLRCSPPSAVVRSDTRHDSPVPCHKIRVAGSGIVNLSAPFVPHHSWYARQSIASRILFSKTTSNRSSNSGRLIIKTRMVCERSRIVPGRCSHVLHSQIREIAAQIVSTRATISDRWRRHAETYTWWD